MAVIKSIDAPAAIRPFSMSDIEAHARTLLLRARQQADQLLAAAQAEAENMKSAGHAEGLAIGKREGVAQGVIEGTEKGRAQAQAEHAQQLRDAAVVMQSIAMEFDAARDGLVRRIEAEVLPLAIAIADKIAKRVGQIDPRVVQENLRDAIRLITNKHEVLIKTHPQQRKLAEEMLGILKERWPQLQHSRFVEDAAIAPGGCIVSTAGGEIAADLDTQLSRIAAELVPAPGVDVPATPSEEI